MFKPMTIGSLADVAGVNLETIRFYQRSGLIDEPVKPMRGYRTYQVADVRRIRFIKRAQLLGFTLEEIASLLKLEGSKTCAETHDLAAKKLTIVKTKLADLTAMEKVLTDLIMSCEIERRTRGCPIIQALIED